MLVRIVRLAVAILALRSACALEAVVPVRRAAVAEGDVWVEAGGKWQRTLPAMPVEPGRRVLLSMQVRVDTAGHGGCNFVLHAAINDRPLNQPRGWPRLLNKPTVYHLRNYGDKVFLWYRPSSSGWSTIFGSDFQAQSVTEGQDFTFLWDVTDLVAGQADDVLTVTHLQPMMPKWTGGRGKLVLRDVELWLAHASHVRDVAKALMAHPSHRATVESARNEPDIDTIGERPYELVRAHREDRPEPTVTFDDLSGWEVALYAGAAGTLTRSREQLLWGEYTGKVTYSLPDLRSVVLLRPKAPIPIAGEFDCVNLWVCGGPSYFLKTPPTVPTVYIRIEDANGEFHELPLGPVKQNYWFPHHGKFAPFRWPGAYGGPTYESWGGDGNAHIEFPARLRGIVLGDCRSPAALTLWLDSLAFYREERSCPPMPPPVGGPKYPTTPDTILPTCRPRHRNSIVREGDGYALTYEGPDGTLSYRVTPATGLLSDVTATWQGRAPIRPLAGGGILFGHALAPSPAKLASAGIKRDALETEWVLTGEAGSHRYTIAYRIKGKTLVVDLAAQDRHGRGFVFGTVQGLAKPKLIHVPYLTIEPVKGPGVLCDDGLFILGLLDWYNTNASRLDGTAEVVSDTEASFNNGSSYLPRTDGVYHPVRERVFLTVSPDFHEVLPNIPNPPSSRLAWASRYIYNMINPPLRPRFLEYLASYGVDHQLAICWGRLWITRQGDSYTYRVLPRPGISVQDVATYAEKVRSMGHVFGLGAGGRDFCPLSKRWDENLVALWPDGSWRLGWPSNYVINHDAARGLARQAGTQLRRLYGPSVLYFDVGTQPSPWRCANDYNALVPGAGKLAAAFRSVCDLMLEMRRHHDFIVSEGGHRWMYAGLSEGDYATIPSRTPKWRRPLIVDFDLLKLHPLQHGVGMGYGPNAFYDWQGSKAEEGKAAWKSEGISRYVAATIAYGHMGCLSNCAGWPLSRTIRYFALVWPLQQEYLTDVAADIRYHDGDGFVSPSRALATDVHHKGRLLVRYRKGLVVAVNYNESEPWEVSVCGQRYELPPFGFAACRPGRVLAYVALRDGQPVDYVESDDLIYARSLAAPARFPALDVHGAALLRRRDAASWWVIPCSGLGSFRWRVDPKRPILHDASGVTTTPADGCREVTIHLGRLLPGVEPARARLFGCSALKEEMAAVPAAVRGGDLVLRPSAQWSRYLLQVPK